MDAGRARLKQNPRPRGVPLRDHAVLKTGSWGKHPLAVPISANLRYIFQGNFCAIAIADGSQ
jgi:hypothetical protein